VLRAKERNLIPSPFIIFTFGLAVESIKELGSASQILLKDGPQTPTIGNWYRNIEK
jgi:hypothetical protein